MGKFNGYVFVDVETTGLDKNLDILLELGIYVTDDQFNPLGAFAEVMYFDYELSKNAIGKFVQEMHEKNGLWIECAQSQNSRRGVEKAAIQFLEAFDWDEKQPMAGSTVQFDRGFLSTQMPSLEAKFHYRNIDISSLKGVWSKYDWLMNDWDGGKKLHRSLPDCEDSANELKSYIKSMRRLYNAAEFGSNHVCA